MSQQHSILSGDVRISVREYGDPTAPTLIAVHGFPDNQQMWVPVADRLSDPSAESSFHVVTYDVRGAGSSEAPRSREAYRTERLVDDLVAVMDATAPGRAVHLLGHDWGSLQLWDAVTTEHEDPRLRGRISSYTSISGPSLDHVARFARTATPEQRKAQARKSWYIKAFHFPVLPELTWRGLHRVLGPAMARSHRLPRGARWGPELGRDGAHGVQLYRANMKPRLRSPRPGRTDVPVQVVVPLHDPFITPAMLTGLDRYVTTLHRVDVDAGHWLPRTHPDLVARLVTEWASRR